MEKSMSYSEQHMISSSNFVKNDEYPIDEYVESVRNSKLEEMKSKSQAGEKSLIEDNQENVSISCNSFGLCSDKYKKMEKTEFDCTNPYRIKLGKEKSEENLYDFPEGKDKVDYFQEKNCEMKNQHVDSNLAPRDP
jgi:hypothetical protein